MIFWILVAIIILIALVEFLSRVNDGDGVAYGLGGAFAVLIVGSCVGALIILAFFAFTNISDKTHTEVAGVTSYELAEGSKVVDDGMVKFIYVEDGELKQFSEYVSSLTVEGSSGTVEIIEVNYEHGTKIVPWGLGGVQKNVVVK